MKMILAPALGSSARRTRNSGFTLVELLVVVVIMTMAYALASPLIGSATAGAQVKAAARQVAAGLRKARSDAVGRQSQTTVTFDLAGRRFVVSTDRREYRLPQAAEVTLYTATAERQATDTAAIRFFPDGGSTGGRISLSANGHRYDIDVSWLTGKVVILD